VDCFGDREDPPSDEEAETALGESIMNGPNRCPNGLVLAGVDQVSFQPDYSTYTAPGSLCFSYTFRTRINCSVWMRS